MKRTETLNARSDLLGARLVNGVLHLTVQEELMARRGGYNVDRLWSDWRDEAFDPYRASPAAVLLLWMIKVREGERRGIVLQGPYGSGKTHLSQLALLYASVALGAKRPLFLSFPHLMTELYLDVQLNDHVSGAKLFSRALASDFLVIDDLGAERTSLFALQHIYPLIMKERPDLERPFIITTNLPLSKWATRPADVKSDNGISLREEQARLADRLSSGLGGRISGTIVVNAESYRRRTA